MAACKKASCWRVLSEGLEQLVKLQVLWQGGASSETMKILNTKPVQLLKTAVL